MDCKHFRHLHLAYLDDTLSGTQMAAAQRHLLRCDACAAHDTLVRRSLMIARSMPAIEPTAAFQRKLRERLAACRDEYGDPRHAMVEPAHVPRHARTMAVVAAGAVLGALAVQGWRQVRVTPLSAAPVMAFDADAPRITGYLQAIAPRAAGYALEYGPGAVPVSAKQHTTDGHGRTQNFRVGPYQSAVLPSY